MSAAVRRLRPDELPAAVPLLTAEGWTFTVEELARLQRLGGAVGALRDGQLVGFLTFIDLPPVRWLGNVVVDERVRGAGLGARLVEEALRGARTTGLYAVEKAVTLYARTGFKEHGVAWAMRAANAAPRAPAATQPMRAEDLLDVARLDREQTGMDRGYLLRALFAAYPDTARIVRDDARLAGFAFAKTYADVTELGPIVATERGAGAGLLDALLALTQGPYEMAVLDAHPAALAAAEKRGFERAFATRVMFHGEPPAWRPRSLFAAAGLEKG